MTKAAEARKRAALRYERIMRSSERREAIYRAMLEHAAADPETVSLLKEAHRQQLEYIARLAEKAGVAKGKDRGAKGTQGRNGRGTRAR